MKAGPFIRLVLAGTMFGSTLCSPALASGEPPRPKLFGDAEPLGTGLLDSQRGGAQVRVVNASTAEGAVHDNQARNVTTGSNWIGGDALAGAAGIPLVVQNSGNNVLIQNSTIVNMQVQ